MVYICAFALASTFIYFAETAYNKGAITGHKGINWYVPVAVAIVLLALLAAFRSSTIGVDVSTYVIAVFNRVSASPSIIDVLTYSSVEQGYEALAYLSSLILDDVHVFHFATEAIILLLVIAAFSSYKKTASLTVAFIAFLFLYFATTLNIVRQSIAIAIVFYSSKYMFSKEYLKYVLGIVVAFFFHRSAIVALMLLFIHVFLSKSEASKFRTILVVLASVFVIGFMNTVISFGVELNLFPQQYSGYIGSEGNSSIASQILARLPLIGLGTILYSQMNNYNEMSKTLFCFLIIDCILGCTSVVIGDASRISLYFGIWQCVYIAEIYKMSGMKMSKSNRCIIRAIIILYLVGYWFYCVPIRNFGMTYPYVSDVLQLVLY